MLTLRNIHKTGEEPICIIKLYNYHIVTQPQAISIQPKTTASIKLFEPDDTKYLKWVNEYLEGFILTASKSLYST